MLPNKVVKAVVGSIAAIYVIICYWVTTRIGLPLTSLIPATVTFATLCVLGCLYYLVKSKPQQHIRDFLQNRQDLALALAYAFVLLILPIVVALKSFSSQNEDALSVLIYDFYSEPGELGEELAEKTHRTLGPNLLREEQDINRYLENLGIDQRVNVVTQRLPKALGHKAADDIGGSIVADYWDVAITGDFVTYKQDPIVRYLRVTILDTVLARVIDSNQPISIASGDTLHQFVQRLDNPLELQVSRIVEYILNISLNFDLIRIAVNMEQHKLIDVALRNKLMREVHARFAKLGEIIGNKKLAAFHVGQTYYYASRLPRAPKARLLALADSSYRASLNMDAQGTSMAKLPGFIYDSTKIRWNLYITYTKLYEETMQTTWLDSAEKQLSKVAKDEPTYEHLSQLFTLLNERLEILKSTAGPAVDFGERKNNCASVGNQLLDIIDQRGVAVMDGTSSRDKVSQEKNEIRRKIDKWQKS